MHLARDLRHEARLVALKLVRQEAESVPTEFRRLSDLRHRSLATVFDTGSADGYSYFTTEYFPGEPLTQLPAPIDWEFLQACVAETCDVLAYLNEAGLRHGDLKPEHVLFATEPAARLCVIDLGHASRLDDPSPRRAGTPPYAPPELWDSTALPTKNSDLYSLGMILLELLSGGLPLPADSDEWVEWHRKADRDRLFAELPVRPPAEFATLLREMIQPDPANRPIDARAVRARVPSPTVFARHDEPALVGREGVLDELRRWLFEPLEDDPHVIILGGPSGIGKSRVLQALTRVARAAGAEVQPVQKLDDTPVVFRVAAPRRQPKLAVLDDAPLTANGHSILEWWREVTRAQSSGANRRGPRPRLLLAPHADVSADEMVSAFEAGRVPSQLRILAPLDWKATTQLAEEILGGLAADESQEIWHRTHGVPGAVVRAARGEEHEADAPPSSVEPEPLRSILDLLARVPAPCPLAALRSTLEIDEQSFWRALAEDPSGRLRVAGTHPNLHVFPVPVDPAPPGEEIAAALLRLAGIWEVSGDQHAEKYAAATRWVAAGREARREIFERATNPLREMVNDRNWESTARLAELLATELPEAKLDLWSAWGKLGRRRAALRGLRRLADDDALPASSRARVGTLFVELGRAREGLPYLLSAFGSSTDTKVRAQLATQIVGMALSLGELETAQRLLADLESAGQLRPDTDRDSDVQRDLASAVARVGRLDEAQALYESALSTARSERDRAGVLRSLSGIAGVLRLKGQPRAAEQRLRLGLRYARASGLANEQPLVLAEPELNLGAMLFAAQRDDDVERIYRHWLPELRRLGRGTMLGHVGGGLGSVYYRRGQILKACRTLLRARRDAEEHESLPALAVILKNLGLIYLSLGDVHRAIRTRLDGLRVAHRIGDPHLVRQGRVALAAALARQGRGDAARSLLDRAATEGSADRWATALAHRVRAELHTLADDPRSALRAWGAACREAIRARDPENVVIAILGLARVVLQRGDKARARALLSRAADWSEAAPNPLRLHPMTRLLELRTQLSASSSTWNTLFHSACAQGLREEALVCIWEQGERHATQMAPEGRRLVEWFRRHTQTEERIALEKRHAAPGLAAWLDESSTTADENSPSPHHDDRTAIDILEDLAESHGTLAVRALLAIGERVFELHSRGFESTEPAEKRARVTLNSWPDGPDLRVELLGVDRSDVDPDEGSWAVLARAWLPEIAARTAQHLTEEGEGLRLQLDQLRERSLSERERLKTEVFSRQLETRQLGSAQSPISDPDASHPRWIARAATTRAIESSLESWGASDLPVVIYGESGTGKDHLARRLHAASPRRNGPVRVESGTAFSSTLFEAEMFGYAAGAFTGAESDRDGLLRQLDGGTLVLDHIDELPLDHQAKLLRFLEDGTFRPVGGAEEVSSDVRVIATSYLAPRDCVLAERLRSDLYYRLQGVEIHIPPLRERPEEIRPLITTYLDWHARRLGVSIPQISPGAMQALESYSWPGNIRELANAVLQLLLLGTRSIDESTVAPLLRNQPLDPPLEEPSPSFGVDPDLPWREANAEFQRSFLTARLRAHGWNRSRAAESLGLSRRQLHNLIEKLELRPDGAGSE